MNLSPRPPASVLLPMPGGTDNPSRPFVSPGGRTRGSSPLSPFSLRFPARGGCLKAMALRQAPSITKRGRDRPEECPKNCLRDLSQNSCAVYSGDMTSKRFGYIRVSTVSQNLDRQTDALVAAGIDAADIYDDRISGARQSRPGLDDLLSRVREGDEITVVSLDRLGRSALHLMQTVAMLEDRGVAVRSLRDGENMGGATGKLMRGLMALVAEWEREMNAERVAEARAARASRAAKGEQVAGRPRTAMTDANVKKVKKLREKGHSAADIARLTSMSRASVYRALSAQ